MDEEFVEAIVECATGARAGVAEWLTTQGLSAQPMVAGVLASGPGRVFDRVFGVSLARIAPPAHLPIPAPLASRVTKITIRSVPTPF